MRSPGSFQMEAIDGTPNEGLVRSECSVESQENCGDAKDQVEGNHNAITQTGEMEWEGPLVRSEGIYTNQLGWRTGLSPGECKTKEREVAEQSRHCGPKFGCQGHEADMRSPKQALSALLL